MMRVKSISELKRVAIQQGATVEVSGERFNTAGVRASLNRPQPEPAAPTPAPQPVLDTAPFAQAHEKLGAMFAAAIASLPQPAAPVREWLFTVERDKDGLLTSIRATAQE